jgi:hypothetical protein
MKNNSNKIFARCEKREDDAIFLLLGVRSSTRT